MPPVPPVPSAYPADLPLVDRENLRADVDARLLAVLAEQSAVLDQISADAAPLGEAWGTMLRGGKRMRAAFAYWSWRAHGGAAAQTTSAERAAVVKVGAALELFQAAALFHDDVMDRSDTRRGEPTAHRAFAARHGDNGWSGDGDQFGLSAAILLGDLSLIASEDEFLRAVSALDHGRITVARALFTRMRTEVTVGQYLDVHAQMLPWEGDFAEDERRAREVVQSKSARYSVECPLLIGAALAGADEDALAACSAFGLPLGEAFQLRDDVLGVFGDPAATGKPAGDDLREGKRTLLLVRTMRALDPAGREELAAAVGREDLSQEDVQHLQDVIEASGALEEIEALISDLTAQSFAALESCDLDPAASQTLEELARATVERAA